MNIEACLGVSQREPVKEAKARVKSDLVIFFRSKKKNYFEWAKSLLLFIIAIEFIPLNLCLTNRQSYIYFYTLLPRITGPLPSSLYSPPENLWQITGKNVRENSSFLTIPKDVFSVGSQGENSRKLPLVYFHFLPKT